MRGWRLIVMGALYPVFAVAAIPNSVNDLNTQSLGETLKIVAQIDGESSAKLHLLREVSEADVPKAIAAAKELANQVDENVIFTLLVRVADEIKSPHPHVDLIESLIRIVAATANEKYVSVLQGVGDLVDANRATLGSARKDIRTLLGQTAGAVRDRVDLTSIAPIAAGPMSIPVADAKIGLNSFREYLEGAAAEPVTGERFAKDKMPATAEAFLLKSLSRDLTDELRLERKAEREGQLPLEFGGRDQAIARAFAVMVRMSGRLPIYVGASGVGKTTAVRMMAKKVFDGEITDSDLFKEQLQNAEFLVTSPSKISQMALSNEPTAQAAAVELFFEAVRKTQEGFQKKYNVKKPLVVVIDNIQALDPPQLVALKQELENTTRPICVVATALPGELDLKIKTVAGFEKDIEKVPLHEFSVDETRDILNGTWAQVFLERFNVTFDNETLDALFRTSASLKPNLALPEAPLKSLEDIAITAHAASPRSSVHLTEKDIYDYAQRITRLPVDPRDAAGFSKYLEDVKSGLQKRVVNQNELIAAAMDALERVLSNNPKRPASVLFMGPTGVGKTLVGETLAQVAFKDKCRFFRIDGTSLQDGEYALGPVFGAPSGLKIAQQTSGSFMEWLDDPACGKYGGVILIDEADKMPLDVWLRLMEFQSGGMIYGGDGKPRYANRHVLIFTSNKGAKVLFPDSVLDWTQSEVNEYVKGIGEDLLKALLQKIDANNPDSIALSPELVGRIQRAALARPITRETAPVVAHIEMDIFVKKYEANFAVDINVLPAVEEHIALTGVNYLSGARPISDQIERYMTPALTLARKTWSLPKNAKIEVGLKPAAPGEPPKLLLTYNGQTIESEAPAVANDNPLLDPEVRDMLEHMAERMHEHMPEQPEAIDAIVKSIKGKYGNIIRKRPISVLVVGRTGLGKTELGRALAYARYKSPDRAIAIPLSDVVDEYSWRTVFIPQFEQALMRNPQGAVLIMDEFSNIGGGEGANKAVLLKKFLNMLEEGVWVSPSGTTYDLRKYFFLFTGNDLETLTQGVTSDDENIAIWEHYHTSAMIEAQLKKNGVPEAFISRQDALAMIKPLVGEGKGNVAGSLLETFRKNAEAQHKGIRITWDNSFASKVGNAFFTHSRGARSMRSVNENLLSSMITESLLKYGYDEKTLAGLTVNFSIQDNAPKSVYLPNEKATTFKREVTVTVDVIKDGNVVQTLSAPAADKAEDIVVLTEDEAKMTAYRELGRAYLNQAATSGIQLAYLSIRGTMIDGEPVIGYSRYVPTLPGRPAALTRRALMARLKGLWGSRLALEKAGYDSDFGGDRIEAEIRGLMTRYLLKFGTGLGPVVVDKDGEPRLTGAQVQRMQNEMQKLEDEARAGATKDIESMWPQITEAVKVLLDKGHITGEGLRGLNSCARILN